MAIVKWVLIAALAAAPAAAQPNVARVIPVKYADVKALANTLSIFGCGMAPNAELKVLAVSCPPDVMTAFEEAVKRLDVAPPPAKNIELTAYFLLAGGKEMPEGKPVPAELEPVLKQIRAAFAYKNFALLDTTVLRTREGRPAGVNGVVSSGTSQGVWNFSIKSASPSAVEGANVVRIDGLTAAVQFRLPPNAKGEISYREAGVKAEVDIRENQKVVVGKSSMEGPDKALIVVLTAKVM